MNGKLYREIEIEQVENGYIIRSGLSKGEQRVFSDIDDVIKHIRDFYGE